MGEGYWLFRVLDRLQDGAIPHVREVDQNPKFIHLADGGATDMAQTSIAGFPAAVTEQVAFVVGELYDPYTE